MCFVCREHDSAWVSSGTFFPVIWADVSDNDKA